jgi:hypothetical protein
VPPFEATVGHKQFANLTREKLEAVKQKKGVTFWNYIPVGVSRGKVQRNACSYPA